MKKKPLIFVVGARGIPNVEGGAEKCAEQVFPELVAQGFAVELFGLAQHLKGPDYRGVRLRPGPNWPLLKTDKLAVYVYAWFSAIWQRPDVVHLQNLGASLFVVAFKMLGLRVVARYGSVDYLHGKFGALGTFACKFSEWQLRFADCVIAVSPSLRSHLEKRGISRRVVVVPNGTDDLFDEVLPGSDTHDPLTTAPYFLAVGRVTTAKNLETLIAATKLFNRGRDVPIRLVIAGGVDDVDYAERLRAMSDINVEFIGRQPRASVYSLLRSCSAFVNSSSYEGMSNAVLEAVSVNCPILLSDIPANRDVLLKEHHYFNVGSPEALAGRFVKLVSEPDAYRPGNLALMKWPDVTAKFAELYGGLGVRAASAMA
jgi:glycosyltransferase involved in cell wall biosynthesis